MDLKSDMSEFIRIYSQNLKVHHEIETVVVMTSTTFQVTNWTIESDEKEVRNAISNSLSLSLNRNQHKRELSMETFDLQKSNISLVYVLKSLFHIIDKTPQFTFLLSLYSTYLFQ